MTSCFSFLVENHVFILTNEIFDLFVARVVNLLFIIKTKNDIYRTRSD